MSNKRARKKQAVLERAAMPISTATSGPVVTIPQSVWNAMVNSMAPQKGQALTFSPGSPLAPIPGITPPTGPRQFSYFPGINLAGNDRTLQRDYIPAFQQLRLLAQTYSAIGMAERIWCDLIPRMDLQVTITDELKAQGKDDKDFKKEIRGYRAFFEEPDGEDDIHEWLRKSIVEQTQIDALAMFKRKSRGGKLEGLDLLDGTDIKPLLDERGRVPVPPYAAYQQYSYGTPGQGYTTDDMIYYRESPRTFTPYGFSRVERIILLVNIALRKQNKDLMRYTEGNIPAGIMEVPEAAGWTPDQIDSFEQSWNALMAGNMQQQVRVKFTQPGMKYQAFDQPEAQMHLTEFDTFLLNMTAGVYGVSMSDLAVTGDIHKSSDDGQQNMLYRRTIEPLAIAYGRIFTKILHEDFGDTRFEVKFSGYDEKEDVQTQVAAFSQGIQYAMISPSDAAAKLGWPDVPKTGPLFVVPGGITPLANFEIGSDTREAQDAATMAGLQQAANPPDPNAQNGGDDGEADKAMGDADKAASSLERFDPVRGPGGEFGYEGKTKSTSGHHGGSKKGTHHAKGPKVPAKQRMHARMQKLSARFAKLASRKIGPHWSEAQAKAAGQLKDTFSKLSDAISKGGQSDAIDSLLDTAHSQAKGVFAGNAKGMNAFAGALTTIDKANDKGLLRGVGIEDDEDEEGEFDDLDDMLDSMEDEQDILARVSDVLASVEEHLRHLRADREEEQGEQRAPTYSEDQTHRYGDLGGGASDTTARRAEASHSPHDGSGSDSAKAIHAEYRKWRLRALDDIKAGKAQRGFTTTLIPQHIHTYISGELQRCTSADDVRALFKRVQDGETQPLQHWQDSNGDVQQKLALLKAEGVTTLTWKAHMAACDACTLNDGQTVKVNERFKSGAFLIPEHANCACSYRDNLGRTFTIGMNGEYQQIKEG